MKNIITILFTTFFLISSALAQSDSVAVFHRPEKVIIQINEGYEVTRRLINLMENLGKENNFTATSPEENIKISCGRGLEEVASCIFKFLPGKNVSIVGKKLEASIDISDLKLESVGNFELYFESSMSDKFLLKIIEGTLTISASKKNLK
jgi:hypothetical protein